MRNPSIHIRLTHLVEILDAIGIATPKAVAMQICAKAVPYTIRDRYVIAGTARTREKAAKALRAAKTADMTVERFNRILDAERRKIGHKHITPIRRGDKSFNMLKEVAIMACDFAHEAGIDNIDEACKIYVNLGLQKMRHSNTYALGKFKYYDPQIYALYESMDTIINDPEKDRTRRFHDTYIELLGEYAGITRDLSKPEDYVNFVFARLEALAAKAKVRDWLMAQFEELKRAFDAVPNPNQLFSEAAAKRYFAYISNGKHKGAEEVVMAEYVPSDDFEHRYNEKLRAKYGEKIK